MIESKGEQGRWSLASEQKARRELACCLKDGYRSNILSK
jgi:hypothetical protein